MMELGPDGYPFEQYIAKLFTYQGFDTETNAGGYGYLPQSVSGEEGKGQGKSRCFARS